MLLAMGFKWPVAAARAGCVRHQEGCPATRASTDEGGYATNVPGVFAAGDIRRGQSLVV